MKELTLYELEELKAGQFSEWVGGFCAGAGIAALVTMNPVLGGAAVGCLIGDAVAPYFE